MFPARPTGAVAGNAWPGRPLGSLAEVGAHSINGSNDNRICCVSIPHEDIKDGVGIAEKSAQNGLGADTGEDGGRRQPPILIGVPGQRLDRLIDARIVPGSHAHVRQKPQEVGGIRRTVAYYASSLSVHVIENYGQLQVRHGKDSTPAAKVYVKVYARRSNGSVDFYKDGYTDLRGRFDYASLSDEGQGPIEKFSILVLSDSEGGVVRETAPPKR